MPTIVDYLTGPLVILIEPQCLIARSAACRRMICFWVFRIRARQAASLVMSRSPSSLRHGELHTKRASGGNWIYEAAPLSMRWLSGDRPR